MLSTDEIMSFVFLFFFNPHCQSGVSQIPIDDPQKNKTKQLCSTWMCTCHASIWILWPLTMTTKSLSGFPVTEAQLDRVAQAEAAACSCLQALLSSLALSACFSQTHFHSTQGGSNWVMTRFALQHLFYLFICYLRVYICLCVWSA